jgi:hemolysin activation/secretion protein
MSNGRVTTNHYAYVDFDVSGITRLPHQFALSTQLSAQYANAALPLAAQIGLGGDGLVRGYTPDDGSFDAGLVSRTEIRMPPFVLLARAGLPDDRLTPFVFVDAGYGRDRALKTNLAVASTGIGADYSLGQHFSAGLNSAWALTDGQRTNRGDWRLQARATMTF